MKNSLIAVHILLMHSLTRAARFSRLDNSFGSFVVVLGFGSDHVDDRAGESSESSERYFTRCTVLRPTRLTGAAI